ncbi:MAG: nitroreductase family protein [Actinobacteria bacterium]|nr:nitroreductase family protein [Actinomycetota bacterium]
MEERHLTKKATRDYGSYSETPWGIWDVMYARRSNRRYLPAEMPDELIRSLEDIVELARGVRGAGGGSVITVTDAGKADLVRRRSYKGFKNKINLWLARSPVSGFLVIAVPVGDAGADRPRELPLAVMAVEDCVLWLTSAGMGTCWLAGVNQREIAGVLGLAGDVAVPVIVSVGKPKPTGRSVSVDSVTARTMSRRRKPLSDIASVETTDRPYTVREIPSRPFSAVPVQEVPGLLCRVRDGEVSPDAPLELVVDACLEAARIAPNAGNLQKWRFIVVKNKDNLGELSGLCGGVTGGRWRAAIVAAGDEGGLGQVIFEKPFWMIDVPIALSHMSLMAASMGCGADVRVDGIDEGGINRLVRLPSGVRTVGVLGIR